MRLIKKIMSYYKKLHKLSQLSIWLGLLTMAVFYITSAFALLIAPYVTYLSAMTIHRGCLEAAPASLAAGVCAGLIGDLMLPKPDKKDEGDENKS